jgi:uncharacterized damage-inducible protein DinB
MLAKDDLSRLLRYTVWANHRLLRAAATMGVEDWRRDLGGSHGGVRGTLAHMMWAELVWLERWKGLPNPPRGDESQFPTVIELRDRWTGLDEHRQAWLEGLPAEAGSTVIHYRTTDGTAYESPLERLVQHAANHSTYHRGQVLSFLRQLGVKPVSTDMLVWDREEDARAVREGMPRPT